jgi:peroxiredoxin
MPETSFLLRHTPSQAGTRMSNAPTYAIRKPVAVILFAGTLAILGLNVALVLQNRTLKKEMAAPPALLPQVGTKIGQLEGAALDGSRLQVSLVGQSEKTLLFVFSTQCGVCDLNWPKWESIAQSVKGRPLRLVYANIASPLSREYAERYGIGNATVFTQLDPRYEAAVNLRLTPLTILLGSDGEVEHVWVGLLEGQQLLELQRTLGLQKFGVKHTNSEGEVLP